jgi:hypothetical protein
MMRWSWLALIALMLPSPASAQMLDVGDEAPTLMLYAYNEVEAVKASDTNTPGLTHFLGVSPERPKDAVLLVFLDHDNGAAATLDMLARLQRKYAAVGQGLQVLVVGIAPRAGEMNEALAAARGVNYPVLRDRFGVVSSRYGVSRTAAPVAYLLVGERPDIDLDGGEEAAIHAAYETRDFEWTVRILGRWTGEMAGQEEAINRSVDAVVGR